MLNDKILKIAEKEIAVVSQKSEDYISLTDMARFKNSETTGLVISHWLSTRYTVEFMGLWEKMNNPLLMLLNSVTLKMKVAAMVLYYLQSNGLRKQMPLVSYQKLEDMVVELMLTKTSHLNLAHGYPLNSNTISSKNFND